MRVANRLGRVVLLVADRAVDVERASAGRFGPDPMSVFEAWEPFLEWAADADFSDGDSFEPEELGPPVPRPRQVFAIGLNYRDHAAESKLPHPEELIVFTKFPSSLAGAESTVRLSSDSVDWEAELVAVVGRSLHLASPDEARVALAGFTVGQDLSDRGMQLRGPAPQFGLAKSFPGFSPIGPALVTLDELPRPDSLSIRAEVSGPTAADHPGGTWTVQDGNTRDMIFPVDQIVSDLSQVLTLFPGDLVFTGTPAGVGAAQGVSLQPGDTLRTTVEGIGTIVNRFVA